MTQVLFKPERINWLQLGCGSSWPSEIDAEQASSWLLDRLSRLAPGVKFATEISAGGGKYLVKLSVD